MSYIFFADRATAKTLTSALRTTGKGTVITHAQTRLDHSAAPAPRASTWVLMA